jgi:hypothetical protein
MNGQNNEIRLEAGVYTFTGFGFRGLDGEVIILPSITSLLAIIGAGVDLTILEGGPRLMYGYSRDTCKNRTQATAQCPFPSQRQRQLAF